MNFIENTRKQYFGMWTQTYKLWTLLNQVLLTPRFQGDFLSAIYSAEMIALLKKKKRQADLQSKFLRLPIKIEVKVPIKTEVKQGIFLTIQRRQT